MAGNNNVVPLDSHPRARLRGADASGSAALDLLAQLFDEVGRDAAMPACVKAEVARLRLPSLRAAQLAPDFLSNRAHPARRLLDMVGVATLGLEESAGADDPTVGAIVSAVHDLLVDFDNDLAPFVAAASRLADFVAERTRLQDEGARPMVQAIVQRELADAPRRAAQEEVARRLRARLWVPAPVRAMLSGPWVRALAAVQASGGEGSDEWHELVRTMDELLWSVEPKASPEGRRRLATILPALVMALIGGLKRAEASEAERDGFLSALVDCHAHAMKAGFRGMTLVSDTSADVSSGPASPQRVTFAAGERRVEEISFAPPPAQADPSDEAVARLLLGAWIEIERGARAAARKRLAWASPVTGTCLFVGLSPTSMGIAMSPDALAELMRRGEARVVDDAPLVERTLAALLARLAPSQG